MEVGRIDKLLQLGNADEAGGPTCRLFFNLRRAAVRWEPIVSDSDLTPLKTARINSERFDTELAAVWFAANYYYESSLRRTSEYCGIVFRESASGQFGITVRTEGKSDRTSIVPDCPESSEIVAIWHTHLPAAVTGEHPGLNYLYSVLVKATTGAQLDELFSENDTTLSASWSTKFGREIPIYLVTATVIKRYRSGTQSEKLWKKEAPSRLR